MANSSMLVLPNQHGIGRPQPGDHRGVVRRAKFSSIREAQVVGLALRGTAGL